MSKQYKCLITFTNLNSNKSSNGRHMTVLTFIV